MGNFVNITANQVNTGGDGQVLGAGDVLFIETGITVAGLSSGSSTGAAWNGVQCTSTTTGITATIDGIVLGTYDGLSVDTVGKSNITVGTTGSVTSLLDTHTGSHPGTGMYLGGGQNTVVNNGQISGPSVALEIAGTGSNSIVNTGLMSAGEESGVYVMGSLNYIKNTGTISGGVDAIEVQEKTGATIGNVIVNGGELSGDTGIDISGVSGVTDTVINSGKIDAFSAGVDDGIGGGALALTNSGVIMAGVVCGSDAVDTIQNTGSIVSESEAISEMGEGVLSLSNSGTVSGQDGGIYFDSDIAKSNRIQNSGTIEGQTAAGIEAFGSSAITIANAAHGVIEGESGIVLGVQGFPGQNANVTITNAGTIQSDGNNDDSGNPNFGIEEAGGGFLTIRNSGTITGGIAVSFAGILGSLSNTGDIAGASIGVDSESSTALTITNAGHISGDRAIVLTGVIAMDNSGLVQGISEGIVVDDATITNSGHITGGTGIVFNGATNHTDVLDNSGTVSATSGAAIAELGTAALRITNSGHIAGGVTFGATDSVYNGTLGSISGTVTGGAGNDTMKGGAGDETFVGGAGNDLLKGGDGDDTLNGGAGADRLVGGSGNNTFVYTNVADSRSGAATHDTIAGFDALNDTFDFEIAVTGVDNAVAGALNKATFNTDMQSILATTLKAHNAVIVSANGGDLAGHVYLVVDDNGNAGFQGTGDYVIELSGAAHLASLSTANFI